MRRFAIKYSLNVLCLFLALSVIQSSTAQILIPIAFNPESTERQWLVNDILDSVINKIPLNKGGIICVTDKFVSIDTITLNKVKRTEGRFSCFGEISEEESEKDQLKRILGIAYQSWRWQTILQWENVYRMGKSDSIHLPDGNLLEENLLFQ